MSRKLGNHWKAISAMRVGDERVYGVRNMSQVMAYRSYISARINPGRTCPVRLAYDLNIGTVTLTCEDIGLSRTAVEILNKRSVSSIEYDAVAREVDAILGRLRAKVADEVMALPELDDSEPLGEII